MLSFSKIGNEPLQGYHRDKQQSNKQKPRYKRGFCYHLFAISHTPFATYAIFISISTPAGKLRLLNDSIIFWLGLAISIKRL